MQRRDFVRSALYGTGAAFSLAVPTALAAIDSNHGDRLHASLAKIELREDIAHWRPIEYCSSSGACKVSPTVRVEITALGFPQHFRAFSIEAMFETNQGLRPFRIAHYQPGAVSPASKPFSFDAESKALAGFRVEHATPQSGPVEVASSALLGAGRTVLAPGHYLLVANTGGSALDLGRLEVPVETSHPLRASDGRDAPFAWLRFSVHAQDA